MSSTGLQPPRWAGAQQLLLPYLSTWTIEKVQTLRCGPLDAWFQHFPLLGNEPFYTLMIPFLLWFGPDSGGAARRFTLMTWLVCFANNFWKEIFTLPRPPRKLHVNAAESAVSTCTVVQPGFPSTHSAHALSLGWLLATEYLGAYPPAPTDMVCPQAVWCLAALHVLNVCTSRLYLGVHFMADILGGLAIGTGCIAAWQAYGATVDEWTTTNGTTGQLATLAAGVLLLGVVYPDKRVTNTAWTETVVFAGLHMGAVLATGKAAFRIPAALFPAWMEEAPYNVLAVQTTAPVWMLAVGFAIGLVVLGVVRTVLSAVAKVLVKAVGGGYAEVLRQYGLSIFVLVWVATSPNIPTMVAEALSQ